MRYVVDSPVSAGSVSTGVEALAAALTGTVVVYAWVRPGSV